MRHRHSHWIIGCAADAMLLLGPGAGLGKEKKGCPDPALPASLSEIVLFGARPIGDLDPSRYSENRRPRIPTIH